MPSRSAGSRAARMPAVSTYRTGTPRMLAPSSMKSRVVPAWGVTMARSSPNRRLKRLDLPALALPVITTRAPSLAMRPSP